MIKYYSDSPEATEQLGQRIAKTLKGNEVIAMFGGLGMGKTAITRGKIYHFDMYRINGIDDLYAIGFFDYLDTGVLIIEWSENIADALPDDSIIVRFERGEDENSRVITVEGERFDENFSV